VSPVSNYPVYGALLDHIGTNESARVVLIQQSTSDLLALLIAGRAERYLPTKLATLDSNQLDISHIVVQDNLCLPSVEELN
jgi:hypothetical protein